MILWQNRQQRLSKEPQRTHGNPSYLYVTVSKLGHYRNTRMDAFSNNTSTSVEREQQCQTLRLTPRITDLILRHVVILMLCIIYTNEQHLQHQNFQKTLYLGRKEEYLCQNMRILLLQLKPPGTPPGTLRGPRRHVLLCALHCRTCQGNRPVCRATHSRDAAHCPMDRDPTCKGREGASIGCTVRTLGFVLCHQRE